MGARNSSAHCQRVVEKMMRNLPEVTTDPFKDDLVVTSDTFIAHLRDLRKVFGLLREYNFYLKRKKCHLFKAEVKFLGHYLSQEGIRPCTEKINAILKMKYPVNVTQIKSFVSACRWFGKFIPNLAHIAAPLYKLLKKNVPFKFTQECQEAFDLLRQKLCEAPILAQPDFDQSFRLYTDASGEAMGAVLVQGEEGRRKL